MRLVDLDPRFAAVPGRQGMGINFRCPACVKDGSDPSHYLGVWFENPIDGGPKYEEGSGYRWKRSGDTFETLTLEPSINYEHHWHGWIRNGEVLTA